MGVEGAGVSAAAPVAQDEELQAIYRGGENFLARMKAMSDARASAEDALANLNLGNDLLAANAEAKAALAEAERIKAQADAALRDAKVSAASILQQAKADADKIAGDAQARAKADLDAASAARADANAYAKETISVANATKADADRLRKDAQAAKDGMAGEERALKDAKVAAVTAAETANAMAVRFERKISELHEQIARIAAL